MKKKSLIGKKLVVVLCTAVVGISILTGCSKSSSPAYDNIQGVAADYGYYSGASNSRDYADNGGWAYEEAECMDADYSDSGVSNVSGAGDGNIQEVAPDYKTQTVKDRKLIRTVDMEVETEEFDTLIAEVEKQVLGFGGYIENEYTYNGSAFSNNNNGRNNKYSNLTLRVPDDKLDAFVSGVSGISNVISKNTSAEDITLRYVDTESKKNMYLAEEESLLELLKAAQSVEDIAYLTERLTQVRYNIESMESTLRKYDDLVDYSTINLNIREVEVFTPTETAPKTTGQKLAEGFRASVLDVVEDLRDFFIGLLINSPYILRVLIILGLIVLAIRVIVAIIKKSVKKSKMRKLQNTSAKQVSAEQAASEKDSSSESEKKNE